MNISFLLSLRLRMLRRSLPAARGALWLALALGSALLLMVAWTFGRVGFALAPFADRGSALWMVVIFEFFVVGGSLFGSGAIQTFDPSLLCRLPIAISRVFNINAVMGMVSAPFLIAAGGWVGFVWGIFLSYGLFASVATAIAGVLLCFSSSVLVQTFGLAVGKLSRTATSLVSLAVAAAIIGPALWWALRLAPAPSSEILKVLTKVSHTIHAFPTVFGFVEIATGASRKVYSQVFLGLGASIAMTGTVVVIGCQVLKWYVVAPAGGGDSTARMNKSRRPVAIPFLRRNPLSYLCYHELRMIWREQRLVPSFLFSQFLAFLLIKGAPEHLKSLVPSLAMVQLGLVFAGNQLGRDRDGVRLLFSMPIRPQVIIVAKQVSFIVMGGTSVALNIALVTYSGRLATAHLGAAIFYAISSLIIAALAGSWFSIHWPSRGQKGWGPPLSPIAFAGESTVLASVSSVFLLGYLVARHQPNAKAQGAWALLLSAILASTWAASSKRMGRSLERRRSDVLLTVEDRATT